MKSVLFTELRDRIFRAIGRFVIPGRCDESSDAKPFSAMNAYKAFCPSLRIFGTSTIGECTSGHSQQAFCSGRFGVEAYAIGTSIGNTQSGDDMSGESERDGEAGSTAVNVVVSLCTERRKESVLSCSGCAKCDGTSGASGVT